MLSPLRHSCAKSCTELGNGFPPSPPEGPQNSVGENSSSCREVVTLLALPVPRPVPKIRQGRLGEIAQGPRGEYQPKVKSKREDRKRFLGGVWVNGSTGYGGKRLDSCR